jgi:hypothetical protein
MMKCLWVGGRLSWPLISSVALFTTSLVAVDAAWRVTTMPIRTFALITVLAFVGTSIGSVVLYRTFRKR